MLCNVAIHICVCEADERVFQRGVYVLRISVSNHINIDRLESMALVSSISVVPSNPTAMDVDSAVFAQVSEAHLRHGAIPVTHYLNDLLFSSLQSISSHVPLPLPPAAQELEPTIPKAVAKIHQACQQKFGSTQAVKFDYEEDALTQGLLTQRNGGAYRSPTSLDRQALYADNHAA